MPLVDVRAFGITSRHDSTETLLILARGEKRAYHAAIVCYKRVVHDSQPEVVATLVRITPQVAKVLHQHKCRIVFSTHKCLTVDRLSQRKRAALVHVGASVVLVDQCRAL